MFECQCKPVCLYYYYDYYNTPLQSGLFEKNVELKQKKTCKHRKLTN
jgi:hypothetical protein